MTTWLIDDSIGFDAGDPVSLARSLTARRRTSDEPRNLALTLHDVAIHDNRKWFGGADLRLDMIVTTECVVREGEPLCFVPKTYSFPGVRDGEALPIGPGGVSGFYGKPMHFLDLSVIVSRDRHDVDDLATLLAAPQRAEVSDAIAYVAELAGAPLVAAIRAAVDAARTLGNVAYKILRSLTGATVGVYRNVHLEHRDNFGIGGLPAEGVFRCQDLSFRYEIREE